MNKRQIYISFIQLLIFLLLSLNASSASFKCWTNFDGIKECGNSLPPQYVKQRVEYLNDKSGRISKVTSAAKTQAQILAEEEMELEQQRKEREITKQNTYDNVLLKTYLGIDDLLLSLHWKMTTLDSRISTSQATIEAENNKFLSYSKQAANIERRGRKIPENIKDKLFESRKNTANLEQRILMLNSDKKDIYEKFSHDINRFTVATINGLTLTLKDDYKARNLNMIQVSCPNKDKCNTLWLVAKDYVNKLANLSFIFDNEQIKTTISPKTTQQLAYDVSRVNNTYNPNQEKITLQIRCHPSNEGNALCASNIVSAQLTQFKQSLLKN